MRKTVPAILAITTLLAGCAAPPGAAPPATAPIPAVQPATAQRPHPSLSEVEPGTRFDVAITGGRVVDPETGLDLVANVAITDGTVKAITLAPIRGTTEIDATGRVVAPGFIDILSYAPDTYGIWYKIADGVTTNLGMHGLGVDAGAWYSEWERIGSPAHFGGAFSYNFARGQIGLGPYRTASPEQIAQLVNLAQKGLENGWIGIDMSLEYHPGTSYDEVLAMARVAAKYGVPLFFHARYSDADPPGTNADALDEILRAARETGAAVHVEHINSTGGTYTMETSLATLARARDEGIDVTACIYPYNFWATYLGSARFDEGWQQRFRIGYGDLEIAGTGERLTAESFARYRAENKLAVAYAIPEADVQIALRSPFVMIGSDAILEPAHNNHPRSTGTYARVLGKYVRELQVLPLIDALAKMTILPAKRLEPHAPALRKKGRLQPGADADITIFNPDTVIDRSTVQNPAQFSEGIDWVLVMGRVVKDPNGLRREVIPGRPVKSDLKP